MPLTANDFAVQIIAQARVLNPSFSGEIGTPERKLIDPVAQSLADNQVDLTGLQSALDIDSKFGSYLDQFTMLFGMQRQQAIAATGYVVFSRNTPAVAQIIIPPGTTLQSITAPDGSGAVQFVTTSSGSIALNATSSGAVPIRAVITGVVGNVPANSITQMVGNIVTGVTGVTNANALTNGIDAEDDNSYKVRFKNTWARNLAGTESQYLALAVTGTYTTKAVVVGTQSRYQEYIQVPSYDDAGYLGGIHITTPVDQNTFGTQNQWTAALSTLPYAKQIYTTTQTYVNNGQQGAAEYFYRPGIDYQFNYPARLTGDTLRESPTTYLTVSATLPTSTITVVSTGRPLTGPVTTPFPATGTLNIGGQIVNYTGITTNTFTGCTGGTGTFGVNTPVYLVPAPGIQPNFTFLNVYNPSAGQIPIPGLQALSPQDVILSEYSYVSTASRNDLNHNVSNAVDVYVNGVNPVQTSCVILPNATTSTFNNNPNSPWYYENYRRDGLPAKRPQLNNYITPLFQPVITSLPASIALNGVNFDLGTDYWLVHETDSLAGSVRARDGIEWNQNSSPTNNIATASAPGSNIPLEVNNYSFDANVPTLQASLEAARQVTTDVLVHASRVRYFKLDITVMYTPSANYALTNAAIASSIQAYFDNQYFGAVIQLSDLLEVIHEVSGVDNVRWSNDLPTIPNLIRVYETDINGNPLHGASVDRLRYGATSVSEQQTLYVVGSPSGINNNVADSFVLSWAADSTNNLPAGMTTAPIPFLNTTTGVPVTGAQIQSAIRAVQPVSGIYNNITVTQDSRPATNVTKPILSFTLTYGANGSALVPTVNNTVTSSQYAFDTDYFLLDNELPSLPSGQTTGDTLPGLIIRPRAQSTFLRPGLV